MAPLMVRDDFPGSSSPVVPIAVVVGVIIGLGILVTLVKAASRASGSRPATHARATPGRAPGHFASDNRRLVSPRTNTP